MLWALFDAISKQFKPVSNDPVPNSNEAQLNKDFENIWKQGADEIDKVWEGIRALTMKGLAAGSIASLTLLGSQQIGGNTPKEGIFTVLLVFILGLSALLFRPFVVIVYAAVERRGRINAVPDGWGGYSPPPIIMNIARILDWAATSLLVGGGYLGLKLLYILSYSVYCNT